MINVAAAAAQRRVVFAQSCGVLLVEGWGGEVLVVTNEGADIRLHFPVPSVWYAGFKVVRYPAQGK